MKRAWPAEFNSIFDTAEEVTIEPVVVEPVNGERPVAHDEPPAPRKALRVRIPMETYERIWPLQRGGSRGLVAGALDTGHLSRDGRAGANGMSIGACAPDGLLPGASKPGRGARRRI